MEIRSVTLQERFVWRSCSGQLLMRGRRNCCFSLRRSPRAQRIYLLFGDSLASRLATRIAFVVLGVAAI
jgi:hypothetical protein